MSRTYVVQKLPADFFSSFHHKLEDKVAALQAENDKAQSENENLRDILSRLQGENLALKQGSFTFAVPKNATESPPATENASSPLQLVGSPQHSASTISTSSPPIPTPPPPSSFSHAAIDWSSLHSLDPAVLDILDETPQVTATDGAMQMDFGFGDGSTYPYTTIVNHPQFMSFADAFEPSHNPNDQNMFDFETNGDASQSTWPTVSLSETPFTSLEDIFASAGYMNTQNSPFVPSMTGSSSSLSPVSHTGRASQTASSSPVSSLSLFNTPGDSPATIPDEHVDNEPSGEQQCPKTKEHLLRAIEAKGMSPFAASTPPALTKDTHAAMGAVVGCGGNSNFPKTAKSDKNIEVLTAWKHITSDPKFKVIFS